MAYVNEQSYEEMMTALRNFKTQIETQCGIMESAGKDCMDNMEEDPAATKSNEKLTKCVAKIRENYETIDKIIAALQDELERAIEAAKKAEKMGD